MKNGSRIESVFSFNFLFFLLLFFSLPFTRLTLKGIRRRGLTRKKGRKTGKEERKKDGKKGRKKEIRKVADFFLFSSLSPLHPVNDVFRSSLTQHWNEWGKKNRILFFLLSLYSSFSISLGKKEKERERNRGRKKKKCAK